MKTSWATHCAQAVLWRCWRQCAGVGRLDRFHICQTEVAAYWSLQDQGFQLKRQLQIINKASQKEQPALFLPLCKQTLLFSQKHHLYFSHIHLFCKPLPDCNVGIWYSVTDKPHHPVKSKTLHILPKKIAPKGVKLIKWLLCEQIMSKLSLINVKPSWRHAGRDNITKEMQLSHLRSLLWKCKHCKANI